MTQDKSTFPLGNSTSIIALAGATGLDSFGTCDEEPTFVQPGRKYLAASYGEIAEIKAKYHIIIPEGHTFPGLSTGNLAIALSKLTESEQIHLFTTLAPEDESTQTVIDAMKHNGIILHNTPYIAKDGSARNPFALILPPETNSRILSFKPLDAPLIEIQLENQPGAMIIGSMGGAWEDSVNNAVDIAIQRTIPLILLASESQVKQLLTDKKKNEAYLRAVRNATAFVGNFTEGRLLLEAAGITPDLSNAAKLAMQVKKLSQGSLKIVSLTRGENGAVLLDEPDEIYELTVPKQEGTVYPLGAGDEYAAVLIQGLRTWGTDTEGIQRSMRKAGEAAAVVLHEKDSQTGQIHKEHFLREPLPEYQVIKNEALQ